LLEIQQEQEVGLFVGAVTPEDAKASLARIQLIEHLLNLPQRVAYLNKEHYDRAKRDANALPDPTESSFHLGDPLYWGPGGEQLDAKRGAGYRV
jgi:hypothetical protein